MDKSDTNIKTDEKKLEVKKQDEKHEEEKKADKEVEELRQTVEELDNRYKRALADYQNLEKRVREERNEWILRANKDLLLHFLPVLDTLMLAEKHSNVKDQGLALSIKQFLDVLKNESIERIETVGKSFDPNLMEGIKTESGEENKVIDELRTGFKMGESVLRPAQVAVGSAKQNEEEIN